MLHENNKSAYRTAHLHRLIITFDFLFLKSTYLKDLLAVQRGCLQFVIVVFPDHTHLLFLLSAKFEYSSQSLLLCGLCV